MGRLPARKPGARSGEGRKDGPLCSTGLRGAYKANALCSDNRDFRRPRLVHYVRRVPALGRGCASALCVLYATVRSLPHAEERAARLEACRVIRNRHTENGGAASRRPARRAQDLHRRAGASFIIRTHAAREAPWDAFHAIVDGVVGGVELDCISHFSVSTGCPLNEISKNTLRLLPRSQNFVQDL